MAFTAKYKGTCPHCGQSWKPGDRLKQIGRRRGVYGHLICPMRPVTVAHKVDPDWTPTHVSKPSFKTAGATTTCALCSDTVYVGSQIIPMTDGVAHLRCVVT